MDLFYKTKVKKLKEPWMYSKNGSLCTVWSTNYSLAIPKFECDLGEKYFDSKLLLLVKRGKIVKKIDMTKVNFDTLRKTHNIDSILTIIYDSNEKIDFEFGTKTTRNEFFSKIAEVLPNASKMVETVLKSDDNK